MEYKNIINPFAQKGRIITGSSFIGRSDNLIALANNVTEQDYPNNLAIIGYPRIGKSSLAKQAIIEQKAKLIAEKKVPVWLDFSKFSNRNAFFKYLVRYSHDELKKLSLSDKETDFYSTEVSKQIEWDDITYSIEKYFEYTISIGIYFIFILDEFDEARSIFHNSSEAFKMLRELAYDSDKYGVAIVTTSRRSIKEIEVRSDCSSSTFNLLFSKEYLKTYNDLDIQSYFNVFSNIGIDLTDIQKSRIIYYCGRHPYLLALLGFEVVEYFKNKHKIEDIDAIFSKIALSIREYYEQLIGLLKEDNTYGKMLQILFGPMLNVSQEDIIELRDIYGLLNDTQLPNNDKGLIAFSQHFQDYLSNVGRKVDFWPLWTDLEIKMREFITQKLKEKHQENWFKVIESRHKEYCQKAEDTRKKSKIDDQVENLLYYFDAKPLFDIILNNKGWNDFKDIFGGDKFKNELSKKVDLIVEIRNPYAHSRFQSIRPNKIEQAELYCNEILGNIDKYLKQG